MSFNYCDRIREHTQSKKALIGYIFFLMKLLIFKTSRLLELKISSKRMKVLRQKIYKIKKYGK